MKKQLLTLFIIISFSTAFGQVGINTTTPGAQLDVRSSNQAAPANTDGVLIPKIDVFPAVNPTAAQNGMMVFLTTTVGINPPGFYYWDSITSTWAGLASSTSKWALAGNTGTVPGTDFLGTTDAKDFVFKTNNSERARFTSGGFLGIGTTSPAQQLEITGNFRLPGSTSTSGIIYSTTNRLLHTNGGFFSGLNAGSLTATGFGNTGVGTNALTAITTGNINSAFGYTAMNSLTSGFNNAAFGYQSMLSSTTAGDNTAVGSQSLKANATGARNTAVGSQSMGAGVSASDNVAIGYGTLSGALTGGFNTAVGNGALGSNTSGFNNSAFGRDVMPVNTTGNRNTALGYGALHSNIAGGSNTAVGTEAGYTALGSGNVMLGFQAGYSEAGSNKLYIDNSNTASPLVYGDFNTNLLRVNGTLNINNAYSFPTTDGTNNYILKTDGAGAVSWVSASSLITESDPNAWLKAGNTGTTPGTDYIGTSDNQDLVIKTNDTEAARISSAGNVGIGTAAPAEKLEVVGNIRTSSLAGTGTQMVQSDTNGTLIPMAAGTASQVLLGTGIWGNVPGITNDWSITGNAGTVPGTNFIGTTDNNAIDFRTNNTIKTRLTTKGQIETLNTGQSVFLGESAGASDDLSSNRNVFIGYNAGMTNTTGADNIALGINSLGLNTTGFNNVAAGPNALYVNTTGFSNAAFGGWALFDNTTGRENTAIGVGSMSSNTTGIQNTAVGLNGLNSNSTGSYNVSVGAKGMDNNIDGINNVSVGYSTLMTNTSGSNNTAVGRTALNGNTTGSNNTAIGYLADVTSPSLTNATAIGYNAKVAGNNSFVLGGMGVDAVKVGIGTTTPAKELEVVGEVRTSSLAGTGTRMVQADTNGTFTPLSAGTASQVLLGTGVWGNVPTTTSWGLTGNSGTVAGTNFLGTTDATDFVFKTNNVERTRLTSAGFMGIGTTTPHAPLEVVGVIMPSSTTANADIEMNSVSRPTIYPNGSNTPANLALQVRSKGTGSLQLNSDNVGNVEMVTGGGNVGIGTNTITQAKVVINGTQNSFQSYGYLSSSGTIGTSSGTVGYSLYASGRIAATEFNAFSDERIKNIKGISNSSKDLETLNKIQITDYTFKDSIGKGTRINKKVIAQQVEKVYPQAVSTVTEVIPDIYTIAKIKDGRVILKNTLQKGDRVKLVFDNRTELVTVLQADEFGFNVAAKDEGKVFVFGREVKDFHTVDYEALSTLNISATQELIKIINQQEVQIRGLKADNSGMNKRLSQTEADINQIKSMFNNTVSSNSK